MTSNIRKKILKAFFCLFFLLTYLPIAFLLIFSFNDSLMAGFPWRKFTLKWWEMFFSSSIAVNSIKTSLIVASVTSVIATLIGLLAAFALVRHNFTGKNLLMYLLVLPLTLPYTLLGVGLLSFLRGVVNVKLSIFTIIIGHVLVALPFSTLIIMARLIGFDRSLEEAAQDLGATELTTFRKITLPLIMPGIFSALFLSFTISLEDIVLAHFLAGSEVTMPIFVFGRLRRAEGLPMVMALSGFMALIVIIATFIYYITSRARTLRR